VIVLYLNVKLLWRKFAIGIVIIDTLTVYILCIL